MAKKLVLAGGGHAHMVTLTQLHAFVEKGFDVTVIGPSAHHYYYNKTSASGGVTPLGSAVAA